MAGYIHICKFIKSKSSHFSWRLSYSLPNEPNAKTRFLDLQKTNITKPRKSPPEESWQANKVIVFAPINTAWKLCSDFCYFYSRAKTAQVISYSLVLLTLRSLVVAVRRDRTTLGRRAHVNVMSCHGVPITLFSDILRFRNRHEVSQSLTT
jgi:hypothetical protein